MVLTNEFGEPSRDKPLLGREEIENELAQNLDGEYRNVFRATRLQRWYTVAQ
jgi:hypothetical protein